VKTPLKVSGSNGFDTKFWKILNEGNLKLKLLTWEQLN
jgi:hypothetical protein